MSESLNKAYKLFTEGKFSNALQAFNLMLWTIPLVVVSSRKEVDEVKELITICRSGTAASQHCHKVVSSVCNTFCCRLAVFDESRFDAVAKAHLLAHLPVCKVRVCKGRFPVMAGKCDW